MGFLEYAFDHTHSGVALVGGDGTILRMNRAGAALIGRDPVGVQREAFLDLIHPDDVAMALAVMAGTFADSPGRPAELRVQRHDGAVVWIRASATLLPTPEPTTYVVFDDITEERRVRASLEADLRHSALHDALTALPTRVLVLDRLERALEDAQATGTQVAVLVCDLDRFKVINDGFGHAAGDTVLCLVAERLRTHVRPGDTVGRFGGDEFVVVCPDVGDLDAVTEMAERLSAAVSEPMQVLSTDLAATVSIGIALGASSGPEVAAGLLRDADAAMYRAKDLGRHRFELFDDEMRSRAATRLQTENELRRALEGDELVLHYQPVLRLGDQSVVGVEALIRWEHPRRGLLEPSAFLPVAGDSGLLADLGEWAFVEACSQLDRWSRSDGWGRRWMAVNLAPRQLADARLLDRIDAAVAAAGADPTLLRVELTEDALVEDDVQSARLLAGLGSRGFGVSVDGFGTGYSSLSYLKRLPVDCLKLDQSFVAGLGDGGDDLVIATAVIVMAQALGLLVVAEGVETRPQLEVLRAMGCDLVQGFLFSPPRPPEDLRQWLAVHSPPA